MKDKYKDLIDLDFEFYKLITSEPYKDKYTSIKQKFRKLFKEKRDRRILMYHVDGEYDWYKELYLLKVNDEEAVWQFIYDNNLSEEYQSCSNSMYDCTGEKFGGEPIIKKICDGRYTLRYSWNYDL